MSGVKDKRLFFLVNPASGSGRAEAFWKETMPLLDKEGYTYAWEYSSEEDVSGQLWAAMEKYSPQVIIAIGGDGILYHALNALIREDKPLREDMAFAAYPAGSACDFGRTVFPAGVPPLISLLEKGEIRNIDIGRCVLGKDKDKTRYFINSFDMGAGADTCVAVNADRGRVKRFWRSGKLAFKFTALKVLMGFKYTLTRVELPDESFEGEYIIMGCGNGSYIGGGMKLFPHASLNDGLLDMLLVPKMGRLAILKAFSRVYDGTITKVNGVRYLQISSLRLLPASSLAVEMDGEIPGTAPAEISVLPAILPLLMLPE